MVALKIGAAERNRTPDLLITNQLLYRLSYCSVCEGADYTFLPAIAKKNRLVNDSTSHGKPINHIDSTGKLIDK
jgi:hypothetical protein